MRNYWIILLYTLQLAWIGGRQPLVFLVIICLLLEMLIAVAMYGGYKTIFGPDRASGAVAVFGVFVLGPLFYLIALVLAQSAGEFDLNLLSNEEVGMIPLSRYKNYILITAGCMLFALFTELIKMPRESRYPILYRGVFVHVLKILAVAGSGLLIIPVVLMFNLPTTLGVVLLIIVRIVLEVFPHRISQWIYRLLRIH